MKKNILIFIIILILCMFSACNRNNKTTVATPVPTMTPVPHMEKILFTYNGDLYWVNTDGTGREEIFYDNNSKWFPSVSPDGLYVAFWAKTKNSYNLWIGDFNTNKTYQLTFDEDNVEGDIQNFNMHNAPIWTKDSQYIIYSRNKDLWKISKDGYNQEALTTTHDCISPALSKDNKLVYARIEKVNTYNLYIKDINSLEDSRLTDFVNEIAASPQWSPKENKIVFTVLDQDVSNIWILEAVDKATVKKLTSDGKSDSPCFSSDGKYIVFSSARIDKYSPELWKMKLDGSDQEKLSTESSVFGVSPSWLYRVLEKPLPTEIPTKSIGMVVTPKTNVENVFAIKSTSTVKAVNTALPTATYAKKSINTPVSQPTIEEKQENELNVKMVKKGNHIFFYPTIHFDSGSANIKEEYFKVLDDINALIKKYKYTYILIEGHTDNIPIHTKSYPSNYELSIARANAVKNYLIKRHKFNENKFIIKGYGEKKPLKPNKSEEERFENRRAEIILQLILKSNSK